MTNELIITNKVLTGNVYNNGAVLDYERYLEKSMNTLNLISDYIKDIKITFFRPYNQVSVDINKLLMYYQHENYRFIEENMSAVDYTLNSNNIALLIHSVTDIEIQLDEKYRKLIERKWLINVVNKPIDYEILNMVLNYYGVKL